MREFLKNIWHQVQAVKIEPKNIVEILILALLIYVLISWIKRSRTWVLLRGVVVLLIFVLLANIFELNVITYIANNSLSILVIAMLVLFQPELRGALEQIGQGKYVRYFLRSSRSKGETLYPPEVIEEILAAAYTMGRARTGALIVLEREIELSKYINTGIRIDGILSSALLINVFEHNTPLHDGAVIMQGKKVAAATCYLPLSANQSIDKELGTRHRAAIGMSEETDSWIVVVSEETGGVSLARSGRLLHNLKREDLRQELLRIESELNGDLIHEEAERIRSRRKRRSRRKESAAKQEGQIKTGGEQHAEEITE